VNGDENRFEQELIYYLEKLDITEKVRLTNHLDYFLETIKGTEANGSTRLYYPGNAKSIRWVLN
jgi:uncharacterized protein YicC (UPF0701 family)